MKGNWTKYVSSPVGKRAGLRLQEVLCGLVEKLLVAFQGSVAFDIHLVLEFKSTVILHGQEGLDAVIESITYLPILADLAIHDNRDIVLGQDLSRADTGYHKHLRRARLTTYQREIHQNESRRPTTPAATITSLVASSVYERPAVST